MAPFHKPDKCVSIKGQMPRCCLWRTSILDHQVEKTQDGWVIMEKSSLPFCTSLVSSKYDIELSDQISKRMYDL